jgi:hypothetical protein
MELRKDFLPDFLVDFNIFMINSLEYNLDLFT